MGQSKQLLPFKGKPLVEHAIVQAINTRLSPIIVIVGAGAGAICRVIAGMPVEIARNENWQTGMGSSITTGMKCLQRIRPAAAAVAILLSDQPLVEARHLLDMRQVLEAGPIEMVAAEYNGTLGVPAFFKRDVFPQLAALPPDAGARRILRGQGARVTRYPLPEAAIDIDTPNDYAALSTPGNL
jgi:CTP:molybdopterin cytidylyltransferase MocA